MLRDGLQSELAAYGEGGGDRDRHRTGDALRVGVGDDRREHGLSGGASEVRVEAGSEGCHAHRRAVAEAAALEETGRQRAPVGR